MRTHWLVVSLVLLLVAPLAIAQDKSKAADPKKDEGKKEETKAKGQLPQQWGKLGLSDDQKQQIYKIQNAANDEIDKLEAKIKELKEGMAKERMKVLTDEQKKRLKDLLTGEKGK